jgi:hypothetical protein
MGNNFFSYIRQLELLAFFSGYPLVYCLVRILFPNPFIRKGREIKIVSILPFAYALTGTLYLGLLLKNIYPGYTLDNIKNRIQQPWLVLWGLLSILFWIPAISRKKMLSILHSLVFFFFIVRDLFFQLMGFSHDSNILKNDMRIYTVSIFLNLLSFSLLTLLYILFPIHKKHSNS